MKIVMAAIVFCIGLLIGSFLNVLIYRISKDEKFAWPFSFRATPGHGLKLRGHIPLLSFLFSGEKCAGKTSFYHLPVELANGIVYLFMYFSFYHVEKLDFIFYSLIASCLIAITVMDLKYQIIPDLLVLWVLGFSVLHKTLLHFLADVSFPVSDSLLGLILAGLLFLLIVIFSDEGMGGGDVTLIAALGFVLGLRMIFLVIFLSFILGALISLFLLAAGLKTRKDPIPFGPFIVLGYFIVLFMGEGLFNILSVSG